MNINGIIYFMDTLHWLLIQLVPLLTAYINAENTGQVGDRVGLRKQKGKIIKLEQ